MIEPRPTLTLVVNTRNEEKHLAAMLASAPGCDEIVVADMESTDDTVAIARRHGARILQMPNAGCCEPGRQAAIDAASGDWILLLDADERLSPGGIAAVRRTIAAAPEIVSAFRLYRDTFVGDTQVLRSGWDVEIEKHVRLFRRGRVTWPARIHATPEVNGDVGSVSRDEVRIVHHNFEDLEAFQEKLNRYTTIEARQTVARGERAPVLDGLRDGLQEIVRRYAPDEDGALSIALAFGLFGYRLFAHAKVSERRGWPAEQVPSRAAMERGVEALWAALRDDLVERRPRGAAPLVSIVIPVFNKEPYTRSCLEAIARNTPGALYEVVIVDNASTDATASLLDALEGDVQVLRNAENVGFVGACNQGAAVARGRYLVFLNNDTAPAEGWLEALLAPVERDPTVGAVGARLVYPDGRLQEAGALVFSDGTGWNFGRGDAPFLARYDRECEVDYCSGAALLVRRDLFEQLGGFDPRYAPAYYEDTDLCFGIRRLGKKVLYAPRSIVVHFEGVTAGTDTAAGFKRYQEVHRAKFVEKWQEELSTHEPPPSLSGVRPASADRVLRRASRIPASARGPAVLVVDPMMPMFDRASGSLRLFRILEAMRGLDARVTYVARNGLGQGMYQACLDALGIDSRLLDPDRMRERGWLVPGGPRLDLPRLLAERCFDVAWLSFHELAAQYLPDLRRYSPRTRVVVDSVDVHFVREEREAALRGDARARRAAREMRRRELATYGAADTVVTVTEADADVLRRHGVRRPIAVVPNVHEAYAGAVPGHAERDGLLFVGNFRHPPNVDAVLWLVRDVLPRIRAAVDVRLFVVGNAPPAAIQALSGPGVVVTGHVPATEPYLDSCRVSVAPLRYGAGMKGKIGEALARGLPVVTTPVGAEGMDLEDGRDALIADGAGAFADAVVRLHRDEALWSRLSVAGRALVEARYAPARVAPRVAALLAAPACAAPRGAEDAA